MTSSSYPITSGGLYDLDTLDEELLTPTGPSPSVVADLLEPKLDNLRSLNKSKAKFQDLMRAADAGEKERSSNVYHLYFYLLCIMKNFCDGVFITFTYMSSISTLFPRT